MISITVNHCHLMDIMVTVMMETRLMRVRVGDRMVMEVVLVMGKHCWWCRQ